MSNYYFISPSGNDAAAGTEAAPWATFTHAIATLLPGDTLLLRNGTYKETCYLWKKHGAAGLPITICAEHDGQAIIDGEGVRVPLSIMGTVSEPSTYIDVSGIVCKSSSGAVVDLGYAEDCNLRRLSAYDCAAGNYHNFTTNRCSRILLEDCAGSGFARCNYCFYESDHITARRCWGRWTEHSGGGGAAIIGVIYGSDDCLIENCIGTMATGAEDAGEPALVEGFVVWANTGNDSANRNRIIGCVTHGLSYYGYAVSSAKYNISGNRLSHCVAIQPYHMGVYVRADDDLTLENLSLIDTQLSGGHAFGIIADITHGVSLEPDFEMNTTVKNCIITAGRYSLDFKESSGTSFANTYNNLWDYSDLAYADDAVAGVGECSLDPAFLTAKFGKGAYLFVPSGSPVRTAGEGGVQMGARVIHRYQDGVLTAQSLWPWPMEARILAETGVSPTWETSGGLWQELPGADEVGVGKGFRDLLHRFFGWMSRKLQQRANPNTDQPIRRNATEGTSELRRNAAESVTDMRRNAADASTQMRR